MNIETVINNIEGQLAIGANQVDVSQIASETGVNVTPEDNSRQNLNRISDIANMSISPVENSDYNVFISSDIEYVMVSRRSRTAVHKILKNSIDKGIVVFSNNPTHPFWKIVSEKYPLIIFPNNTEIDTDADIAESGWTESDNFFKKGGIVAFKKNLILKNNSELNRLSYDASRSVTKTRMIAEAFVVEEDNSELISANIITSVVNEINQEISNAHRETENFSRQLASAQRNIASYEERIAQMKEQEKRAAEGLEDSAARSETRIKGKLDTIKANFSITDAVAELENVESCDFDGTTYSVTTTPLTMNMRDVAYDVGVVNFTLTTQAIVNVTSAHPLVTATRTELDLSSILIPVVEALGRGQVDRAVTMILGLLASDIAKRPRGYQLSENEPGFH